MPFLRRFISVVVVASLLVEPIPAGPIASSQPPPPAHLTCFLKESLVPRTQIPSGKVISPVPRISHLRQTALEPLSGPPSTNSLQRAAWVTLAALSVSVLSYYFSANPAQDIALAGISWFTATTLRLPEGSDRPGVGPYDTEWERARKSVVKKLEQLAALLEQVNERFVAMPYARFEPHKKRLVRLSIDDLRVEISPSDAEILVSQAIRMVGGTGRGETLQGLQEASQMLKTMTDAFRNHRPWDVDALTQPTQEIREVRKFIQMVNTLLKPGGHLDSEKVVSIESGRRRDVISENRHFRFDDSDGPAHQTLGSPFVPDRRAVHPRMQRLIDLQQTLRIIRDRVKAHPDVLEDVPFAHYVEEAARAAGLNLPDTVVIPVVAAAVLLHERATAEFVLESLGDSDLFLVAFMAIEAVSSEDRLRFSDRQYQSHREKLFAAAVDRLLEYDPESPGPSSEFRPAGMSPSLRAGQRAALLAPSARDAMGKVEKIRRRVKKLLKIYREAKHEQREVDVIRLRRMIWSLMDDLRAWEADARHRMARLPRLIGMTAAIEDLAILQPVFWIFEKAWQKDRLPTDDEVAQAVLTMTGPIYDLHPTVWLSHSFQKPTPLDMNALLGFFQNLIWKVLLPAYEVVWVEHKERLKGASRDLRLAPGYRTLVLNRLRQLARYHITVHNLNSDDALVPPAMSRGPTPLTPHDADGSGSGAAASPARDPFPSPESAIRARSEDPIGLRIRAVIDLLEAARRTFEASETPDFRDAFQGYVTAAISQAATPIPDNVAAELLTTAAMLRERSRREDVLLSLKVAYLWTTMLLLAHIEPERSSGRFEPAVNPSGLRRFQDKLLTYLQGGPAGNHGSVTTVLRSSAWITLLAVVTAIAVLFSPTSAPQDASYAVFSWLLFTALRLPIDSDRPGLGPLSNEADNAWKRAKQRVEEERRDQPQQDPIYQTLVRLREGFQAVAIYVAEGGYGRLSHRMVKQLAVNRFALGGSAVNVRLLPDLIRKAQAIDPTNRPEAIAGSLLLAGEMIGAMAEGYRQTGEWNEDQVLVACPEQFRERSGLFLDAVHDLIRQRTNVTIMPRSPTRNVDAPALSSGSMALHTAIENYLQLTGESTRTKRYEKIFDRLASRRGERLQSVLDVLESALDQVDTYSNDAAGQGLQKFSTRQSQKQPAILHGTIVSLLITTAALLHGSLTRKHVKLSLEKARDLVLAMLIEGMNSENITHRVAGDNLSRDRDFVQFVETIIGEPNKPPENHGEWPSAGMGYLTRAGRRVAYLEALALRAEREGRPSDAAHIYSRIPRLVVMLAPLDERFLFEPVLRVLRKGWLTDRRPSDIEVSRGLREGLELVRAIHKGAVWRGRLMTLHPMFDLPLIEGWYVATAWNHLVPEFYRRWVTTPGKDPDALEKISFDAELPATRAHIDFNAKAGITSPAALGGLSRARLAAS